MLLEREKKEILSSRILTLQHLRFFTLKLRFWHEKMTANNCEEWSSSLEGISEGTLGKKFERVF